MDRAAPDSQATRVLQITEAAGGGVRRHLQRLVPELRRLGLDVDLLVATGRAEMGLAADLAEFREQGCRTATFPSAGSLVTVSRGLWALRQALREWQPDVLHLHATRAGLVGRLCRRWQHSHPGVVYSPHAFAFQAPGPGLMPRIARRVESCLAAATDRFVCVSTGERDAALGALRVAPERVLVIENGLEADFRERQLPRETVRRAWGVAPGTCLVGFCGRLVPQKDLATLLDGLALCRQRLPGLRVAVCGAGPLEPALRRQARRQCLEPCVQWLGFVPDLPRRMTGFDLVALPSRYEGFPYALLEALAAGVPVLASDIPPHLPRPWLQGPVRLVHPGDPAAWAEALDTALATLAHWQKEAAAQADRVLQEFSARRQAQELATLYTALAADK